MQLGYVFLGLVFLLDSLGKVVGDLNKKMNAKRRGCLVLKKYHSSLLTQFSSLITYHLKYPNFLNPTRLAHYFQFLITQIFLFFMGLILEHLVKAFLLAYPRNTHSPSFSSLLISPSALQPYYSPKTQTQTHKNRRSSLTNLYCHQGRFTHLFDVYRQCDLLRRDPIAPMKSEETPISPDPKQKLLHPFLNFSTCKWI